MLEYLPVAHGRRHDVRVGGHAHLKFCQSQDFTFLLVIAHEVIEATSDLFLVAKFAFPNDKDSPSLSSYLGKIAPVAINV
jgi:hypothetical protein